MTTLPAPDTATTPDRGPEPRQRTPDDEHVAMVKAAARRCIVRVRMHDGRVLTGVLFRWPNPHGSHRKRGRKATLRVLSGAYVSFPADPATVTITYDPKAVTP